MPCETAKSTSFAFGDAAFTPSTAGRRSLPREGGGSNDEGGPGLGGSRGRLSRVWRESSSDRGVLAHLGEPEGRVLLEAHRVPGGDDLGEEAVDQRAGDAARSAESGSGDAAVAKPLRSQIASGDLQVGDPIPSTTELTERYGYSVTVVRKAVEVLRNEGLAMGQPGKAVYVQATPAQLDAERVSVDDLARQVAELRSEVRDLAERLDAGSQVKELMAEIADLRGTVEQLYIRLGHAYPSNDTGSAQPRHRETGS
ncbi:MULTISPECIES: GntR family transcriptional regulator [unclassified Nonomuraea]|uniref:GntR family transcriptional regulator n=1 Tax=unclassified Nonomuraea TaxID=2593643 RepID=UPI0033D49B5A